MSLIAESYIEHAQRHGVRAAAMIETLDVKRFQRTCHQNDKIQPSSTIEASIPTDCENNSAAWGNYLEYRLRELNAVDRKLIDAIKDAFVHYDAIQARDVGYIVEEAEDWDKLRQQTDLMMSQQEELDPDDFEFLEQSTRRLSTAIPDYAPPSLDPAIPLQQRIGPPVHQPLEVVLAVRW